MSNIPVPPTEADPVKNGQWKGEAPGDSIAGIVTARETCASEKYGSTFDVLTVQTGEGETRVPCARTHLAQLLAEHDPRPGDGVAISFFGRPDGFTYEYAMRVNKPTEADVVPF